MKYIKKDNLIKFIKEIVIVLLISIIVFVNIDLKKYSVLITITSNNELYVLQSTQKVLESDSNVEFTDEMLEELKPTEQDLKMLNETNALYLDIFNN